MKFLRMMPGYGETVITEGDPRLGEEREALVREFRRQLDEGMWAGVPLEKQGGRREALLITDFEQIPAGADRVLFWPRAMGGAPAHGGHPRGS